MHESPTETKTTTITKRNNRLILAEMLITNRSLGQGSFSDIKRRWPILLWTSEHIWNHFHAFFKEKSTQDFLFTSKLIICCSQLIIYQVVLRHWQCNDMVRLITLQFLLVNIRWNEENNWNSNLWFNINTSFVWFSYLNLFHYWSEVQRSISS